MASRQWTLIMSKSFHSDITTLKTKNISTHYRHMLKMTNFMIWEFTGTRFAGKTELSLSSGRYITHYGVKPTWTSRLLDENKWKIHFHRSKWSMAAARFTFDPPREDRKNDPLQKYYVTLQEIPFILLCHWSNTVHQLINHTLHTMVILTFYYVKLVSNQLVFLVFGH